jgi:AraC-like DNA-binding protein
MSLQPTSATPEYFGHLLTGGFTGEAYLGDVPTAASEPGDPPPIFHPAARLMVVMAGEQRYAFSRCGRRVEAVLRPGDAIFFAPEAWSLTFWDRPCAFWGVVFWHNYTRYISVADPGGERMRYETQSACHVRAIEEPGTLLLNALIRAAEEPETDPKLVRPVLQALIHAAGRHLAARTTEEVVDKKIGKRHTYRRLIDLLHVRCSDPDLSRTEAARELGLHPNYLSALCREVGGQGFHETLRQLRLRYAQRLLTGETSAEEPRRVADVAALCGYADPAYFIKEFRREFGVTPGRYRSQSQTETRK